MSDIFDNQARHRRWLVVVPFVAVLAVLLLEIETPGIRVTPSLLTISLAIFALFLSPRAVLWWAVVLFFPVVATLLLVPNNGVKETVTFVALRSAAYIAVAWVAVGLSRYRWDSERRLAGLLALFDALKTPIVVSDIDGNIKFANQACCELLGRDAAEIKDTNFFSVFSQPDRRGQSIEGYLKFFEKAVGKGSSMTVSVQKADGEITRSANCFTMEWDKRRLLVTQLS
jgi:PAS domain S-box-containing protein